MSGFRSPDLSAVLVTYGWEPIAPVLEWLRVQTAVERIELVIVAESPEEIEGRVETLSEFARVRVVEGDGEASITTARARGVASSTAPVVFIGETHTFGAPEWAEEVIRAHREWDVVVPTFRNGNPGTALSWAAFIQDYGICGEGRAPQELTSWPGYNATYRRDLLLEFGDTLDERLTQGDELWKGIRERGGRTYLTSRAFLAHVNVDRPGSWVHERYLVGHTIAGIRRRDWSWPRRLGYALAAPLIALIVTWRNLEAYRLAVRSARLPRWTGTAWLGGLLIRTFGEFVGYLFGIDRSALRAMERYEIERFAHVHTAEFAHVRAAD